LNKQIESKQFSPLSMVTAGRRVKLVAVDAGKALKGRLAAMGLVPGVEITVIGSSRPGPFVIGLRGSKIILGRGMAHKIMVK